MSKFKSPNYTPTPNELFDEHMASMGNAELRVVMAVVRKTMGWHKERDIISISQYMKLTGLSRQGVLDGIAAATEHGFIRRIPRGNSFEYELAVYPLDQNSQASRLANGLPARHTKEREININKTPSPLRAETPKVPAKIARNILRARQKQ